MELTGEMKSVAMQAESVEELLKLAEEYGYSVSKEEAEEIFAELNREGELADEELENVAGGACYSKDSHGRLIVTLGNSCKLYKPDFYVPEDELKNYTGTCNSCRHRIGGVPSYCLIRTRKNDPCK